ncbi:hypothetical protein [Microbispora rosea]|uniref:hypothetical protein n=1 Tax=Microbispora rosea TaxID=58117 RepID=UPI003D925968
MDWFLHRDLVLPGSPTLPEPPEAPVFAALAWLLESNPINQLVNLARSAHTERQKDEFYDRALGVIDREPVGLIRFDPAAARAALLAGRDLDEPEVPAQQGRAAFTHLIAGLGMGLDEVGADVLAESLADVGLYPGLSVDTWRQAVQNIELSADRDKFDGVVMRYDPLGAVRSASIKQLRRARKVLYGLSGFGAMYLMHALLMPDTPGLAALRARIDELGVGLLLMDMCTGMNRTRYAAANLVSCLEPWPGAIYELLSDQVVSGPPLIEGPDSEETGERFMEEWLAAMASLRRGVTSDGNVDGNVSN